MRSSKPAPKQKVTREQMLTKIARLMTEVNGLEESLRPIQARRVEVQQAIHELSGELIGYIGSDALEVFQGEEDHTVIVVYNGSEERFVKLVHLTYLAKK